VRCNRTGGAPPHPPLGHLLPVGGEDHSSPLSDDAHDGVPKHTACLGVHPCGGFILRGGERGQRGVDLEVAFLGHCVLSGWLP
jgi:hypothetical protein